VSAAASSSSRSGIKLGAEPRKLLILGGLLVVAVGVFLYNSGSDGGGSEAGGGSAAVRPNGAPAVAVNGGTRPRIRRRATQRNSERNTLRMQEVTVEAQRGNIDPTLRLDLLQRLKTVKFTGGNRSLFEAGPAAIAAAHAAPANVKVMPGPLPQNPGQPGGPAGSAQPQTAPIPLKFYGFSAPVNSPGPRRGFFLDGEDVVVANEGDTVKGRYHIVSLQPKTAEVEDTTTKNRQTLPIIPEMQSNGF
jgi:hypothetical protein